MTLLNESATRPINRVVLRNRMIIGAAIGLAIISIFLLGADKPDPQWGEFWMVKPLIMVPLAGATAGFINYFLMHLVKNSSGLKKAIAVILSALAYFIGLWMGVVLGLNGTMWD